MPKQKNRTFVMDQDTSEMLRKMAADEDRTESNMLRRLIAQEYARRQAEAPRLSPPVILDPTPRP